MNLYFYFSKSAFVVAIILIIGCKESPKPVVQRTGSISATQSRPIIKTLPPEDTSKIYTVFAKVTAISEADSTITIDHAKMEGFMEAMEMAYKADPSILKEVRVGTKGHFTLKVVDGEGVIISVHVHKH